MLKFKKFFKEAVGIEAENHLKINALVNECVYFGHSHDGYDQEHEAEIGLVRWGMEAETLPSLMGKRGGGLSSPLLFFLIMPIHIFFIPKPFAPKNSTSTS